MRFLALWLVLLAAPAVASAEDATFKVGVTTRNFVPAEPYDWRGASAHILRVTIWYPAAANAREEAQWVGPRIVPLIGAGRGAPDAALADGPRRPLVVLSHGFGGAASDLAWLGAALAAHGFIAVALNHPGNNALEGTTVEGFALMWLRATDLAATIDAMLSDRTFGERIDPARIGAAGHSLGGYTVLVAAGGLTDPSRLQAFCRSPAADVLCTPQRGILELRQKSQALLGSDPEFQKRHAHAGDSYRDQRIRAVLAMAPGPGPALTPEGLAKISIPVALVAGSSDEVAPATSGAEAIGKAIPRAALTLIPHAGHFAFVGTCTLAGWLFIPAVCREPDGADRDAVHATTLELALEFFTSNLR